MTALTEFLVEILKDIACGPDLALIELRAAAEAFFTRSTMWRETIAPRAWKAQAQVTATPGATTTFSKTAHGFVTGDLVLLGEMASPWTPLMGYLWPITVSDQNTFTIAADSTGWAATTARVSIPVYAIPDSTTSYARVCEVLGAESSAPTVGSTSAVFRTSNPSGPNLSVVSPDRLDTERPEWTREIGQPFCIVGMDDHRIRFVPAPQQSEPYAWALRVALTLKDDADQIPDWIFERWKEQIAAGARARLRRQAGKPWSSPDLFALEHALFEEGIYKAGYRARRGYSRAPIVANPVIYGGL